MTSKIVFNGFKKQNNPALLISCYLHIKRKAVVHAPNVLGISNITVLPKPLLRSSRTIASAIYIALKQRAKDTTQQKSVRNGWLSQYSAGAKQRYLHICCLSTPIKDAQTKMHFNIAVNSLPARNAVFPAETPDKTQIPPSQQRWSDVK